MKTFLFILIALLMSGCFLERKLIYEGDDLVIESKEPNRFTLGRFIGSDSIDKKSCWVYTDTTKVCVFSNSVDYLLGERLYWYGTYKLYLISRDSRNWYVIKCFNK